MGHCVRVCVCVRFLEYFDHKFDMRRVEAPIDPRVFMMRRTHAHENTASADNAAAFLTQ